VEKVERGRGEKREIGKEKRKERKRENK